MGSGRGPPRPQDRRRRDPLRPRHLTGAFSFSPCGRRWPEGPDEGARRSSRVFVLAPQRCDPRRETLHPNPLPQGEREQVALTPPPPWPSPSG
ncbi:MAG: hypothetical protein C0458_28675 [Methylobacterium sp.]|nr:hypothetical protein [Methylobacterium sp.]